MLSSHAGWPSILPARIFSSISSGVRTVYCRIYAMISWSVSLGSRSSHARAASCSICSRSRCAVLARVSQTADTWHLHPIAAWRTILPEAAYRNDRTRVYEAAERVARPSLPVRVCIPLTNGGQVWSPQTGTMRPTGRMSTARPWFRGRDAGQRHPAKHATHCRLRQGSPPGFNAATGQSPGAAPPGSTAPPAGRRASIASCGTRAPAAAAAAGCPRRPGRATLELEARCLRGHRGGRAPASPQGSAAWPTRKPGAPRRAGNPH